MSDLGLSSGLVTFAASEAQRLGVTMDAALLACRLLDEESLYRALAARLGLPFVADVALAPVDDCSTAPAVGLAQLAPGAVGG